MTTQASERPGPPPGGVTGGLAEKIDCARLAARAALGIAFDTDAAVGWRARWILQWAIEIDRPLTEGVLALTPGLLADLARLQNRLAE